MEVSAKKLADRYAGLLREYLQNASEISLAQAYEVARLALKEGYGILDIANIHHESLRRYLEGREVSDEVLRKAGDFLSECLSPFEMSHRGAQEGTRALCHVNEVLESELKRIAHALHDEAGQLLASVHIALADVAADLPPQTRARIEAIQFLLRKIESELRCLSHELRPTMLDNLGLLPALEFLAEKVSKRTGLGVSVSAETNGRLPAAVETALYRIVQEALNNAAKHACANSVRIELECSRNKVACRIRDDGVGFSPRGEPGAHGLGLIGIRERLNAIGGTLNVITQPGQGTTIVTDIPLEE